MAFGYNPNTNTETNVHIEPHHIPVIKIEEHSRCNSDEYVLDFEAPWMVPGNSGGPVLAEGGGVVAIMKEFYEAAESNTSARGTRIGRATSVYPVIDLFFSPFESDRTIDSHPSLSF
jgi:hypothetical protein